MLNFADQCQDMARSILEHNLDAINEDGSITPVDTESPRPDESGHTALALGEYYRLTGETHIDNFDLIDLSARCITAQTFTEEPFERGFAYSALGLLAFGASKDRNPIWERLVDATRNRIDKRLLERINHSGHLQVYNIAKAVARFSMALSKQDDTGKLIDQFISRIDNHSTANYCDDVPQKGIGGVFDIYGILSFTLIRQALQLHSNIPLRERKLPSLRTFAEKYLRLLPDIVRQDGLGWIYGRSIGAYGQMHCISIILQAMRDGWIRQDQQPSYTDILRRLFQFFFMTYLNREHGYLVIRDQERTMSEAHTTRTANFDGARYLCQWARLARSIGTEMNPKPLPVRTSGRYVIFDKTNRKEQGLFVYQDTESGLHIQLPLVGAGGRTRSDSLAFPHCPGVFDWPAQCYLPVLLPELTFGEHVVIPSYYGRRCVAGLGSRNSFYFRYEQPELITKSEKMVPGLGSAKISWTFNRNKVTSDFIFRVRKRVQLDRMRYVLVIGAPHSIYRIGTTYTLEQEGLKCSVLKDDFQAIWQETEVVTDKPSYKSTYGNIHYIQTLTRNHPLIMHPSQQYRLTVSFNPKITFADE